MYFKNFPIIGYEFGDSNESAFIQNLSSYVDVIDRLKDNINTYSFYEIKDFDRPDSLSGRLYGDDKYYWTFYLMNDTIKEQGWPQTNQDIYDYAIKAYPDWSADFDTGAVLQDTITIASNVSKLYPNGTAVKIVRTVGADISGTVVRTNLEVGEIIIKSDFASVNDTYTAIKYTDGSNQFSINDLVYEYNGTHHFTDTDGNQAGLVDDVGTKVIVTNLENMVSENDLLKRIKIIKRSEIETITSQFNRLIKN